MAKRARHDLPAVQDKRAQVVELRAQGRTWDQIAAQTGYSNGSAASKAWRAAIRQRPDLTVDEIRAQEKARLEEMDACLADIIARPPVRTTSIGRTQWDVRTCSCPVKARTDRDHDPDCEVQPVLEVGLIVASVKERRQLGESLRRLTGADAPPKLPVFDEAAMVKAAEIRVAQRLLDAQAPVTLAALPADYAAMTPEQQMRADLERRGAAIQIQRAAIAQHQAEDDDVAEAEIVDG